MVNSTSTDNVVDLTPRDGLEDEGQQVDGQSDQKEDKSPQGNSLTIELESASVEGVIVHDSTEKRKKKTPKLRSITRLIRSIPSRFPRLSACVGGIVFPLWFLIGLAYLGGRFVAEFEAPNEYDANDSILANKARVENAEVALNRSRLDLLPTFPQRCLSDFFEQSRNPETNETLFELIVGGANESFLTSLSQVEAGDFDWPQVLVDLHEHVEGCGATLGNIFDTYEEFVEASSTPINFDDLTFDWIRCWNEGRFGEYLTFQPTAAQMAAAANQSNFYEATWSMDQERLEELYIEELGEFPSEIELLMARNRSIIEATGRGGCTQNTVGTTWFFFTVMTTIGYGNQAPVTTGGRALTAGFGFFSIIAFGVVAAIAAQMMIVIVEDLLARLNIHYLGRHSSAAIFWFLVALAWNCFVGQQAFWWWEERIPEEDQPYASWWDSTWFAFISTTTVGLGDFFLQPEYIFMQDVLGFSFLFLTAFVFYATLLGHLTVLFSSVFPDSLDILKHRVANTNLTNMERNTDPKEEEEIAEQETMIMRQRLRAILEKEEGELENGVEQELEALKEKEELLKTLLEQVTEERREKEEVEILA